MFYKINRIDGKDDELTQSSYKTYDEAYDLIDEVCGDLCCSDIENRPYYEIQLLNNNDFIHKAEESNLLN